MKRVRRRTATIVFALIAAFELHSQAADLLAMNSGTTILAGNLVIHIEGALSPKALPKNKMAPVSFHASASVSTANGSHVPPALGAELQVDKHISIDTAGLPVCTSAKIEASSPSQAMKACGPALIERAEPPPRSIPRIAPLYRQGPTACLQRPVGRWRVGTTPLPSVAWASR